MKKFLLALVVAASSFAAADAQVFLGGRLGLWHNSKAETTNVSFAPEVGYALKNKWTLAAELNYDLQEKALYGKDLNTFSFNPYARYTAASWGPVNLIFDGTVNLGWEKVKGADAQFAWGVGVRPGLAVNISPRVSFVTSLGFVGFRDSDLSGQQFGYNLSSKNVSFGVYYNF